MDKQSSLPAGLLTATITPLHVDLSPDHSRLIQHIKWLLNRGNDGVALLGTTGEANSFNVDERMEILDAVIEGGITPGKLLVGTGCCSISDTVQLTRQAYAHKVGGILLLPPFYYKQVNDAGLESYFSSVLDAGIKCRRCWMYFRHS